MQMSKMNLFVKIVNNFQQKVLSQMLGWLLNTSLKMVTNTEAKNIAISKLKTSLKNIKTFVYFVSVDHNISDNRKQVHNTA